MKSPEFKISYPAGTVIFSAGDEADCAYIIEQGEIEISIEKDSQSLVIATLHAGELLGEMALVDDQQRNATATSTESVELIVIPRAYIKKKISLCDPTLRFFLQVIMERYRDVHARLVHVVEHLGGNSDKNPQNCYADTSNVVKQLTRQYIHMQERIMSALNTSSSQLDASAKYNHEVMHTTGVLNLDHSLRSAIDNNEFELYYQPIIDLASNQVAGCEALIRWNHPELGFVSPADFIPVAEENGTIVAIGEWVIKEACSALARFQDQTTHLHSEHGLYMSINLSSRQFEDEQLLDKIEGMLNASPVNNQQVKFEITESLLMSNPDLAMLALDKLKALGVTLAIDDFGTGYSSFSYLNRFPIDTLKIDRIFVHTMSENRKSTTIVHSLVELAHNLGMNVIAEGVETLAERDKLQNFGCDYAQGYYYSRPVPETTLMAMLKNRTH